MIAAEPRETPIEHPHDYPEELRRGVNLVGYLSAKRGVGEAARRLLDGLGAAGVPTAAIDAPTDPRRLPELGALRHEDHPYDINLICVNADMLPGVAAGAGPALFSGRRNVGVWFWEVSSLPEELWGAFEHVDEVWVASEHVESALRPVSPAPVRTLRLPVSPEEPRRAPSRAELGLPEGFCFLFVFDYRSVFRRKNPLGAVEAFCRAFEPRSGPSLVLKSIGGERFPDERRRLADAVASRPDIHLIEEPVGAEEKNAMIASCDCYLSLHRSEGLGLTMAEAMYFGRPVIATSYSGNLDFMSADNAYLVPHSLVPVGPGAAPYPEEAEWAEPDLEVAAALIRRVFEEPETAAARGRRAAADIRRTHSPAAAARTLASRLAQARRAILLDRVGSDSALSERLAHLLGVAGQPPAPPESSAARAAAKRLYLRLLRPYSSYQSEVDRSLAAALEEVRGQLVEALEIELEADGGR